MEKEEAALRNYCSRRISLARGKQQLETPEEEGRRKHKEHSHGGRETRSGCAPQGGAGDERREQRRGRHRPSLGLNPGQGPEEQTVPAQLISMLRLQTFKEEMRRAAEAELHDPTVCRVCVREQASVALRSFISGKKTQLHVQTLTGRLNTHSSCGECACRGSCKVSKSPSVMPLAGFGRNMCGSQQPGVALATAKEREVALETDEMRGYPDKNATGTHLARPRCPFSDR